MDVFKLFMRILVGLLFSAQFGSATEDPESAFPISPPLVTPHSQADSPLSTGQIQGIVIDSQSNEPLAGVNITLMGTHLGAATTVAGDFCLQEIPIGQYQLTAAFTGFETCQINKVVVKPDSIAKLAIALNPTILLNEENVVGPNSLPLVPRKKDFRGVDNSVDPGITAMEANNLMDPKITAFEADNSMDPKITIQINALTIRKKKRFDLNKPLQPWKPQPSDSKTNSN